MPLPHLIFSDLDGTLLRDDGTLPDGFWEMYRHLKQRGIPFVPSSGRQVFKLQQLFGDESDEMNFIAENGNMVMHNNEVVSATVMDDEIVGQVEQVIRAMGRDTDHDIGLVVCGHKSAYTERTDTRFLQEVRRYYSEVAVVPDMTHIPDKVLKLAIFDFDSAQDAYQHFERFSGSHAVVVSSENWIDIMDKQINKGVAVRALCKALGVDPKNAAAFGDYLNDVEMLQSVGQSYAMANAHPDIKAIAKLQAKSNTEAGVVKAINEMFEGEVEYGVSGLELRPLQAERAM